MTHKYVLGRKQVKSKIIYIALAIFSIFLLVGGIEVTKYLEVQGVVASASQPSVKLPEEKAFLPLIDNNFMLEPLLKQKASEVFNSDYSFVFSNNDSTYQHNQNETMNSASLYKLFVAHAVLEKIDAQAMSLSDSAINELTMSECLGIMITISDNPCGVYLQSIINPTSYNETLRERGYLCTDVGGYFPQTCAHDVSRLLSDIINSSILTEQSSDYLYQLMLDQKIRDRIPAGINSAVVANKTADLNDVSHDAAIIEVNNDKYSLVVMTRSNQSAPHLEIAEFAKFIEELFL